MSETTAKRPGFTGELWRSIDGIYTSILAHPFLRGLTDGSLPEDCFRNYVLHRAVKLSIGSATYALRRLRSRTATGQGAAMIRRERS